MRANTTTQTFGNMQPTYIRGIHRDVYVARYQRITAQATLLFPELPTIKAAA